MTLEQAQHVTTSVEPSLKPVMRRRRPAWHILGKTSAPFCVEIAHPMKCSILVNSYNLMLEIHMTNVLNALTPVTLRSSFLLIRALTIICATGPGYPSVCASRKFRLSSSASLLLMLRTELRGD